MKPPAVNLGTSTENTWCPGCPDHMILRSTKDAIQALIDSKKYKQEDFCITTDIGCHGKIFDYLNLSGIYCLHGRAIPTGIGVKLGNPNLKLITFVGDGAIYAEGLSHFIHAFKYNADMTVVLNDNQAFSLTTGQPTPTTQIGYESKNSPLGTFDKPFNPLKLALASNASFIARANARDMPHLQEMITKAIAHKGFSFIEVIQDCIVFNLEVNKKDERMYKVEDNSDIKKAHAYAEEYDYNSQKGKVPIGIIYQSNEPTLEEKWPQLKKLLDTKTTWQEK